MAISLFQLNTMVSIVYNHDINKPKLRLKMVKSQVRIFLKKSLIHPKNLILQMVFIFLYQDFWDLRLFQFFCVI